MIHAGKRMDLNFGYLENWIEKKEDNFLYGSYPLFLYSIAVNANDKMKENAEEKM